MSNLIDDALANPLVGAVATALAIAGVALWIAGAWWAWRDATRRTGSSAAAYVAAGWVLVSTPILLPLALLVYAVLRPPMTAAEHRAQRLIATLAVDAVADAACPGCAGFVDHEWVRCPQCATWLAAPCSNCSEWSPANLEICPFCGREGHASPVVEDALPARTDQRIPQAGAPRRAEQWSAARMTSSVARRIGA